MPCTGAIRGPCVFACASGLAFTSFFRAFLDGALFGEESRPFEAPCDAFQPELCACETFRDFAFFTFPRGLVGVSDAGVGAGEKNIWVGVTTAPVFDAAVETVGGAGV